MEALFAQSLAAFACASHDMSAAGATAACTTLSELLQSASLKGVRLPSWLCLPEISIGLRRALDDAGPAAIDYRRVLPIMLVFESAVRHIAIQTDRVKLSEKNIDKLFADSYVLILLMLEKVQKSGFERADDEETITMSMKCYHAYILLLLTSQIESFHFLPKILSGPFLAQFIQTCLHFAGHRAKQAAVASLQCLNKLLKLAYVHGGSLGSASLWQSYYPGIFSGLYAVCNSGFRSHIECKPFDLLLEALNNGEECAPAAYHFSCSHPWRAATGQIVASRIIDLLPTCFRIVFKQLSGQQRSEIIVILRDLLCDWGALTFFSQEELHVLFRLLYTSLGAISETWGCDLLGPEAALPTLRWRYEALSIWSLIRSCVWKSFRNDLKEAIKFGRSGGRDEDLLNNLRGIVGALKLFGDEFYENECDPGLSQGPGPQSDWRTLYVKCLQILLIPNLEGTRLTMLESRRYHCREYINAFYDGGAKFINTEFDEDCSGRENNCSGMVRQMCYLFGQKGKLDYLVRAVKQSLHQLNSIGLFLSSPGIIDAGCLWQDLKHVTYDSNQASCDDKELLVETFVNSEKKALEARRNVLLQRCVSCVQESVGSWMSLKFALRGYLQLPQHVQSPSFRRFSYNITCCAVCESTSQTDKTLIGLLQCGRCKYVSYCSRKHQKVHWPIHKSSCACFTTLMAPMQSEKQKYYVNSPSQELQNVISVCLQNIESYLSSPGPVQQGSDQYQSRWITSSRIILGTALLIATATEIIADIAEFLADTFQAYLIEVLYPFLALSIDENTIVNTAAHTSLGRIAVYLGYRDANHLLRINLDYVTDSICVSLRDSVLHCRAEQWYEDVSLHKTRPSLVGSRAPSIVELVMTMLAHCDQQSDRSVLSDNVKESQNESALLRDMVLNIMDSVDTFAACGLLEFSEVKSLLKVLHVIVQRYFCNSIFMDCRFNFWWSKLYDRTNLSSSASAVPEMSFNKLGVGAFESLKDFVFNLKRLRGGSCFDSDSNDTDGNIISRCDTSFLEENQDCDVKFSAQCNLIMEVVKSNVLSLPEFCQGIVCSIIKDAMLKLRNFRSTLLPLVHKLWPGLMNRLREHRQVLSCTSSSVQTGLEKFTPRNQLVSLSRQPETDGEDSKLQSDEGNDDLRLNGPDKYRDLKLKRSCLHNLPLLLDLLMVIADCSGDFLTTKFQEDFWPEIDKMILVLCGFELAAHYSVGKGDIPHSKYNLAPGSVETKCKEAILRCLLHLTGSHLGENTEHPVVQPYMIQAVPSCAINVLPLLHPTQPERIRNYAEALMFQLVKLDPAWVRTLIQSICSYSNFTSLLVLVCDPRLIGVISATVSILNMKSRDTTEQNDVFCRLLRSLCANNCVQNTVRKILNHIHACENEGILPVFENEGGLWMDRVDAVLLYDMKWKQNIKYWSRT